MASLPPLLASTSQVEEWDVHDMRLLDVALWTKATWQKTRRTRESIPQWRVPKLSKKKNWGCVCFSFGCLKCIHLCQWGWLRVVRKSDVYYHLDHLGLKSRFCWSKWQPRRMHRKRIWCHYLWLHLLWNYCLSPSKVDSLNTAESDRRKHHVQTVSWKVCMTSTVLSKQLVFDAPWDFPDACDCLKSSLHDERGPPPYNPTRYDRYDLECTCVGLRPGIAVSNAVWKSSWRVNPSRTLRCLTSNVDIGLSNHPLVISSTPQILTS